MGATAAPAMADEPEPVPAEEPAEAEVGDVSADATLGLELVIFDDGTVQPFNYVEDVVPAWKAELLPIAERGQLGLMTLEDEVRWDELVLANAFGPSIYRPSQSSATLPATVVAQEKSWWCGPAAAYSVIESWHGLKGFPRRSARDDKTLTQAHLAHADYTGALTNPDNHSATKLGREGHEARPQPLAL